MNASFANTGTPSLWLSLWAKATVCATFALLGLGAIVTTFHVGMADPIWPTYPWHLLLISWDEPKAGYLIEHSHRLAGYIVGCCSIVLTIGLWVEYRRPWLRVLGAAALLGVIVQGLLGGFRVYLDERFGIQLALVHGSFAPIVFTLLVSVAVLTSKAWHQSTRFVTAASKDVAIRRWAICTSVLVYVQIFLGSFLRHTYSTIGSRGHLLVAFAVVVSVVCLVKEIFAHAGGRSLLGFAALLVVLVGLQILLGVEAWMLKFLSYSDVTVQALIRTGHVLMGSLILATSLVVTLQTFRLEGSGNAGWTGFRASRRWGGGAA